MASGMADTQMIAAMAIENQMTSSSPVPQPLLAWAEYWYAISWKGLLIAGVITALGACATIAFLLLQWRTANIRETQSEWRASSLELQATEAKRGAADALERVASLNQETIELARKNQSLEQMVEPRRLSSAQEHDIKDLWKAFSGHSVSLWSYGTDIESGALSDQIKNCLVGAHVVVVNNIGQLVSSGAPHVGIQIAGSNKRLVSSIYAGLHTIAGLDATVIDLTGDDAAEAVPAEIFVGMKPSPQQK
jgi:hypothetical protein